MNVNVEVRGEMEEKLYTLRKNGIDVTKFINDVLGVLVIAAKMEKED